MKDDTIEHKESLLSKIDSPSDLRKLEIEQLPQLCDEIRHFIIKNLSENPGHFASSMGAVDLIVALHYVFFTPEDRIVWDVGHQAYAHKILTGRKNQFNKQRTFGGISGFPFPMENEADVFMAGHAGNSISAALGMAIADKSTPGHENRKTVAVIGDASISGGLAFEGLNNASNNPNDLLIILNDNDMSIDNNVGALHGYLSDLTTSAGYNRIRNKMALYLRKKGILTEPRRRAIIRFGNSVKSLVSKKQNIFEGLNIRYFGPIDGHDVIKLVKVLKEIKEMSGPRLLHLYTTKGKGFEPAEIDPATWHAPGKFNPETGERTFKDLKNLPPLWQDVFGETLLELATENPDIVGITAAMPAGTSISIMADKMPERTFDVGISEGHAVTFAGGMAAAGKRPFVAIYSSFLQRAYDNIIHDVAIQKLPVTFCIDRAGLVGEDGVTHHGLFDIPYLSCIPSMSIASPSDEVMLRDLLKTAETYDAPLAIRYPRGRGHTIHWKKDMKRLIPGKGKKVISNPGSEIALLSVGPILEEALLAEKNLKEKNIPVDVFDMIWIKPLDKQLLSEIAKNYKGVVTIEDGAIQGGFGQSVANILRETDKSIEIVNLGVPDQWVLHGKTEELHSLCGFDAKGIENSVSKMNDKIASK